MEIRDYDTDSTEAEERPAPVPDKSNEWDGWGEAPVNSTSAHDEQTATDAVETTDVAPVQQPQHDSNWDGWGQGSPDRVETADVPTAPQPAALDEAQQELAPQPDARSADDFARQDSPECREKAAEAREAVEAAFQVTPDAPLDASEAPSYKELVEQSEARRLDDADDGWGVSQQPESAEGTGEHIAEAGQIREPERDLERSNEVDIGDGGSGARSAVPDIDESRRAVRDLIDERDRDEGTPTLDWFKSLPVTDEAIADRTSNNRISLADDVPAIASTPDYGGYLDVVMHGDESQTQADIGGQRVDFTSEQVADMIQSSDSWDARPIRLMSCKTGQEGLAQDLADRLGVPVYAPSEDLSVLPDGTTFVADGGSWRRFEPPPQ